MRKWFAEWWLLLVLVVATIGTIGWVVVYSNAHHCHGDGKYYWSIMCVSTGKTVVCYPVRYEEVVCDK